MYIHQLIILALTVNDLKGVGVVIENKGVTNKCCWIIYKLTSLSM